MFMLIINVNNLQILTVDYQGKVTFALEYLRIIISLLSFSPLPTVLMSIYNR